MSSSSVNSRVWVLVSVLTLFSSCSRSSKPSAESKNSAFAASSDREINSGTTALLNLEYDKPAVVGSKGRATASGLAPGSNVDLIWGTVNGGWVVEGYYQFKGKKYTQSSTSLGQFPIDSSGKLDASFTVPEDYGGVHEIIAQINGKPVAQNGINVTQSFEMSPKSGPAGTPVEIRVKGLGWRTMESTWVVNWDNHVLGWVSAASTRGSAVARFRATGPAGDHIVKMYSGWQGQSYLNYEQSPVAVLPRPQFTFRTIAGTVPQKIYAEPYQQASIPKAEVHVAGATLALTPSQGPVGTKVVLRADGFPKNASLQLAWETYVGSRVSGNGFLSDEREIGQIEVGGDGKIETPITIPEDLGGLHALVLKQGDQELGRASYVIETSIVSMTPASGPVGTPVSIHLKGVGWTEYDNIYAATYDNAYMGYACGFNSQGDVVINFTASGEPGPHLIDLYPGIYQGPATEPQQLYRSPQLTYAEDHPGNKIPALRFIFEVTPSTGLAKPVTTD
jgi:hypothetical protein